MCGDSYGGSYPVIAILTMYHDKELTTAVGAMYGKGKWNATLRGGYRSEDEEYVYPERRMKTSHAFGTMDVQWLDLNVSPLRLSIDAHAAYSSCLTHKVVMPYANMKEAFTTMIRHKADYAKAKELALIGWGRWNNPEQYPEYEQVGYAEPAMELMDGAGIQYRILDEDEITDPENPDLFNMGLDENLEILD